MRKPIQPESLKALRNREGLSQQELADKSGVKKDTISRIERGKQTGASSKQDELAKALKVARGVLTGEQAMPADDSNPSLSARQFQMNIRVDGAVHNAFSLVARRYQIPIARIIELAPFLFVGAAERSLDRRRTRLQVLNNALGDVDAAAEAFGYLPRTMISTESDQAGGLNEETESIAKLDILAADVGYGLTHEREERPLKSDYNYLVDNPFVVSLREEAPGHDVAEIIAFSREQLSYRVCGAEVMKITNGDSDLARFISDGGALLREMPRELLKDEASEDRLTWLRDKKIAFDADKERFFMEEELPGLLAAEHESPT